MATAKQMAVRRRFAALARAGKLKKGSTLGRLTGGKARRRGRRGRGARRKISFRRGGSTSTKSRRHTHMARRGGRRKRTRGGFKIPVVTTAIVLGQAALAISEAGGLNLAAADRFQDKYTGISFSNKDFNPARLFIGWGPWLVKGFVGKVARGVGARP